MVEEEDEEELAETVVENHPPEVSVVSKEQALKLLNPGRRGRGKPVDEVVRGKFVDLVELLPPVPAKGEFDVNKIKASLYFFS